MRYKSKLIYAIASILYLVPIRVINNPGGNMKAIILVGGSKISPEHLIYRKYVNKKNGGLK